jgi:hypothetical protein
MWSTGFDGYVSASIVSAVGMVVPWPILAKAGASHPAGNRPDLPPPRRPC